MKIILISDLHLLNENPVGRIDYLPETQFQKIDYLFSYAQKTSSVILQAGDFFDRPRSWYLLPRVIRNIKKYEVPIFCVAGQHDVYMYNETSKSATSLGILAETKLVAILNDKPLCLNKNIHLYGCSYGQEIPEIKNKDLITILVIHAPIAESAAWPGQGYMDALTFLKKHPFDIIVCGDIHQSFHKIYKGRHIINTGPMIRKEATAYNFLHKPGIFTYDISKEEMNWVEIPHKPAEEVLSRAHIEYENEANSILNEFISSINNSEIDEGSDFVENLWKFVKQNNISQNVIDVLSEVINVNANY